MNSDCIVLNMGLVKEAFSYITTWQSVPQGHPLGLMWFCMGNQVLSHVKLIAGYSLCFT